MKAFQRIKQRHAEADAAGERADRESAARIAEFNAEARGNAEARLPHFQSAAMIDSNGTPHCPKCGGTQFQAVRGAMPYLVLGVAGALTKPTMVECITCGQRFLRAGHAPDPV